MMMMMMKMVIIIIKIIVIIIITVLVAVLVLVTIAVTGRWWWKRWYSNGGYGDVDVEEGDDDHIFFSQNSTKHINYFFVALAKWSALCLRTRHDDHTMSTHNIIIV